MPGKLTAALSILCCVEVGEGKEGRSTPGQRYQEESMSSVAMDRVETRTTESMSEMAGRMTKELRAEMHNSEVQLSHWVAEREQRLGDIQVAKQPLWLLLLLLEEEDSRHSSQ